MKTGVLHGQVHVKISDTVLEVDYIYDIWGGGYEIDAIFVYMGTSNKGLPAWRLVDWENESTSADFYHIPQHRIETAIARDIAHNMQYVG